MSSSCRRMSYRESRNVNTLTSLSKSRPAAVHMSDWLLRRNGDQQRLIYRKEASFRTFEENRWDVFPTRNHVQRRSVWVIGSGSLWFGIFVWMTPTSGIGSFTRYNYDQMAPYSCYVGTIEKTSPVFPKGRSPERLIVVLTTYKILSWRKDVSSVLLKGSEWFLSFR